jgi:hypothetical protein
MSPKRSASENKERYRLTIPHSPKVEKIILNHVSQQTEDASVFVRHASSPRHHRETGTRVLSEATYRHGEFERRMRKKNPERFYAPEFAKFDALCEV